MSKQSQYLLEADTCRKMADHASSMEAKERWLSLSARWLALGEQVSGNTAPEFATMIRNNGTGQESSDSKN